MLDLSELKMGGSQFKKLDYDEALTLNYLAPGSRPLSVVALGDDWTKILSNAHPKSAALSRFAN